MTPSKHTPYFINQTPQTLTQNKQQDGGQHSSAHFSTNTYTKFQIFDGNYPQKNATLIDPLATAPKKPDPSHRRKIYHLQLELGQWLRRVGIQFLHRGTSLTKDGTPKIFICKTNSNNMGSLWIPVNLQKVTMHTELLTARCSSFAVHFWLWFVENALEFREKAGRFVDMRVLEGLDSWNQLELIVHYTSMYLPAANASKLCFKAPVSGANK
jgi:hypothetical protein